MILTDGAHIVDTDQADTLVTFDTKIQNRLNDVLEDTFSIWKSRRSQYWFITCEQKSFFVSALGNRLLATHTISLVDVCKDEESLRKAIILHRLVAPDNLKIEV